MIAQCVLPYFSPLELFLIDKRTIGLFRLYFRISVIDYGHWRLVLCLLCALGATTSSRDITLFNYFFLPEYILNESNEAQLITVSPIYIRAR